MEGSWVTSRGRRWRREEREFNISGDGAWVLLPSGGSESEDEELEGEEEEADEEEEAEADEVC